MVALNKQNRRQPSPFQADETVDLASMVGHCQSDQRHMNSKDAQAVVSVVFASVAHVVTVVVCYC